MESVACFRRIIVQILLKFTSSLCKKFDNPETNYSVHFFQPKRVSDVVYVAFEIIDNNYLLHQEYLHV